MTTGTGKDALPAQRGDFAQAYEELRADSSIQFAEVPRPEQEPPPDWFISMLEFLGSVFAPIARFLVYIWPVLMWVLIALGVALLLLAIIRLVEPDFLRKRTDGGAGEEEWAPDQVEALALLEEADRLASEGRYDEATHLLLQRSVGQIAAARPDLVEPSSTARELSAEPRLPEGARNAFSIIATRVERSLFALSKLNIDDWQAARDAYADFALQQKAIAA